MMKERRVTKRSLKELELWWHLYNLGNYCSQDLIDVDKLEEMYDDILDGYILGEDILNIIYNAVEKLPDHENLSIWSYLIYLRSLLGEMPEDIF